MSKKIDFHVSPPLRVAEPIDISTNQELPPYTIARIAGVPALIIKRPPNTISSDDDINNYVIALGETSPQKDLNTYKYSNINESETHLFVVYKSPFLFVCGTIVSTADVGIVTLEGSLKAIGEMYRAYPSYIGNSTVSIVFSPLENEYQLIKNSSGSESISGFVRLA